MAHKAGEKAKECEKQDDILIDSGKVRVQLSKVPNWKSPGPDGLQGYWLKNFTSCIDRIAKHLQECLVTYNVSLVAVKNEQLLGEDKEKATIQLERQDRYRNNSLHGRFFKATDDVRDEKTRNG